MVSLSYCLLVCGRFAGLGRGLGIGVGLAVGVARTSKKMRFNGGVNLLFHKSALGDSRWGRKRMSRLFLSFLRNHE
jgi:hypothetical protein